MVNASTDVAVVSEKTPNGMPQAVAEDLNEVSKAITAAFRRRMRAVQ